jgi:hypothetical protein
MIAERGGGLDGPPILLDDRKEWLDASWWQREIGKILSVPDPVLCNLRITLAHYQLSRILQAVTGANAGANFHTWAVWGSKKAGETIRQEDTRALRRVFYLVGGGCGLGLVAASAMALSPRTIIAGLSLGCLIGIAPTVMLRRSLNRTRREILAGNCTVLEDIGNVTARFVSAFHGRPQVEADDFERFLSGLRPGKTEAGGQALLARAYLHYYQASYEKDIDRKHEQMFLANCYAILHEHIRLEPYIRAAIPPVFRRLITARMLRFYIGGDALHVHDDVPPERDQVFPETLRELENSELIAFLQGMEAWDRTPNALESSRANDWSNLKDRMNFIVDLFRSRHLSPAVFARPFTDRQEAELMAGRVPKGPL